MRAVRFKMAVKCPSCYEIINLEDYDLPEPVDTWRCDECGHITENGPGDHAACRHDPPQVVKEQCPECDAWQDPQAWHERKQCPLCDDWIDPDCTDFDENVEVYRCGECETIHHDRDEAMECCRYVK